MNLKDYLPEEYASSKEVSAIQAAVQPEIDMVWEGRNDFLLQLDPRTATWGLELWERAFGLATDASKNIEHRRTRVIAKIRGNGTTTAELVKSVAESFSNGEVDLKRFPSEYRVEIHFTGTVGIPPNMEDLQDALEEIMPAHLAWEFFIYFRIHEQLQPYTHGQLATFTHETIRGGDLTDGN